MGRAVSAVVRGFVLSLALAPLAAAALGDSDPPKPTPTPAPVVIRFSAEQYAQALQATGYNVKKQLNLGSEQIALRAVKSGQVDAYPEYTGTALTSFFGKKATQVPHDEQKAYQQAKAGFAKDGLTALPRVEA